MNNMISIIGTVMLLQVASTYAESCTGTTCYFELVVRERRSMTYTSPAGHTYNVAWNATEGRLQIIENAFHRSSPNLGPAHPSDPTLIGTFVNDEDVITTDGTTRNIYVINDQFPGPTLEVMEGAEVRVKVINHLHTETFTIHFHGQHFQDNVWMDGVGYVTQCPILPQQAFEYRFSADPAGTYFYHGHFGSNRVDGIFGAFVVHETVPIVKEHVMMVQDWYHETGNTHWVMNPNNNDYRGSGERSIFPIFRDFSVDGNEVTSLVYDSTLIGGRGRLESTPDLLPLATYDVCKGFRHRFRVINPGAELTYEVMVDSHVVDIVALDGQEISPVTVDSFIVSPGERIDFEIDAFAVCDQYWIRAEVLRQRFSFPALVQDGVIKGTKAILRYDETTASGDPSSARRVCTVIDPCVVFNCPYLGYPDSQFKTCLTLNDVQSAHSATELDLLYGISDTDVDEYFLNWGFNFGPSVNGRQLIPPNSPFSGNNMDSIVPCDATCESGCRCTNVLEISYGRTIQLVLSNYQNSPIMSHHAIHIHGHSFAVMAAGYAGYNSTTGLWSQANGDVLCDTDLCAHASWTSGPPVFNSRPVVKDTINVPARGYVVVRFKATNPGFWMLHCHQEVHAAEGMAMVIAEAVDFRPPVPYNFPTCGDFECLW